MGWLSDIGDSIGDIFEDGVDWLEDTVSDFAHNPLDALGGLAEDSVKGLAGFVTAGASNRYDSGYLRSMLAPSSAEATAENRKATIRSTTAPQEIVYGEVKKGGIIVYAESDGEDDRFLHLIVVLASHSCKRIKEIYFGDDKVAEGGLHISNDAQQFVIETTHAAKLTAQAQLGGHSSLAPFILNATPSSWTSDHKLLGHAFLYLQLEYDRELYRSGVPNISVVMEGKDDIYDPRNYSYSYTKNQALCALDYMLLSGGMNIPSSEISMDSFENAADVADAVVDVKPIDGLPDYTSEPRYEVNGVLSINTPPLQNLESLLQAGASWLTRPQGKWYIVPTGYTAPVLSLTEDDLVGGLQFSPLSDKQSRLNTVRGTFVNPHQEWEVTDYTPFKIDAYVSNDLEELTKNIDQPLVTSGYQCQRLGKLLIERSRYGLTVTGAFGFKALELAAGDRLTLSVSGLGWVDKVFQVKNVDLSMLGGIALVLQEDAPEIYQWSATDAIELLVPPAINLPNATAVLTPTDLLIAQEAYIDDVLSKIRTRLTATWTPGSLANHSYDIQFKPDGGTYELLAESWSDTTYSIDNVGPGIYWFRVRSKNSLGVLSTEWLEGSIEINHLASEYIDLTAPMFNINNLKLYDNETAQFTGRDAKFTWDNVNATLEYFLTYLVEILDTDDSVIRTETTVDPFYDYTYEKNAEDGLRRAFKIRVTAISKNLTDTDENYRGLASTFAANNEAPALPTGLNISAGFKVLQIRFIAPDDLDYKEMRVWMSTTTGFVRDDSSLVAVNPGSPISIPELEDGTQYYLRVAPYDSFGEGAVSSEFNVQTMDLDAFGLSPWAYVTQVDRDFIDQYVEDDSIESTKIKSLTASRITTGTLAASRAISVEGRIEASIAPYNVTMGPKDIAGNVSLFSYMNNLTPIVAFYEDGTAEFTGNVTITNGSGYSNLTDTPNNLSDINSTEGDKLGGIEDGATNTTHTSQLTDDAALGANAEWANIANLPDHLNETPTIGLNLTSTHMGYNADGTAGGWKTYFNNSGGMYLNGDGSNFLSWDGVALTYQGKIQTASGTGERIEISTDTNQFHAYWNRGDGTIEELVNIGNTGTSSGAITLGSSNFLGSNIIATTNGSGRIGIGSWSLRGTGLYGHTEGAGEYGVWGQSESTGPGVYGNSWQGNGVEGTAGNGYGVLGIGGEAGVKGESSFSHGIHGVSTSSTTGDAGVLGESANQSGVRGESDNFYGVLGTGGLAGVRANSTAGHGAYITTTAASSDKFGALITSASTIGVVGEGYSAGFKGVGTGPSGKGVVGEATGASARGVEGRGGLYDFYAGGAGTNYGPFTGAHDALLPKSEPSFVEGDIVKIASIAARSTLSNVLAEIEVQDQVEAKDSFGVIVTSNELPDENDTAAMMYLSDAEYQTFKTSHYLATVNGVGEGQINVVSEGGNIEVGDFICTSSTLGKGKLYSGNDMRLVVARAIEPVDWSSEAANEKQIACIYMCS